MSAYHSPSEYPARSMGPHYCLGCGSDWPCVGSQMEAAERRAAPSPALTREALAAALPHRRSDLARRWVNLDASNGEFATFVLAALGGEPQDG